jgi:hypothetical protein
VKALRERWIPIARPRSQQPQAKRSASRRGMTLQDERLPPARGPAGVSATVRAACGSPASPVTCRPAAEVTVSGQSVTLLTTADGGAITLAITLYLIADPTIETSSLRSVLEPRDRGRDRQRGAGGRQRDRTCRYERARVVRDTGIAAEGGEIHLLRRPPRDEAQGTWRRSRDPPTCGS